MTNKIESVLYVTEHAQPNMFFKAFCNYLYFSPMWFYHRKSTLQRLSIAYTEIIKLLLNITLSLYVNSIIWGFHKIFSRYYEIYFMLL